MDTIIDFIPELEENYNTLKDYAPVPDSWRASNDDEGPNHYFDWPNGPGRVDIAILSWSICLAKELGEDSPDYNFVAKVAGVLCHYIGDFSNPLHCTENYDPPDAYFSHGDIDSWLEKRADFSDVIIPEVTPQFIQDIHNYTMTQIESNYHIAEERLIPAMYSNNVTEISAIVEEQVPKAVIFFTDVVYTAYISSNETNIDAVMNPKSIGLIETVIHSSPILDQETVTILLIAGVFVLSIAFVTIKKVKKRK